MVETQRNFFFLPTIAERRKKGSKIWKKSFFKLQAVIGRNVRTTGQYTLTAQYTLRAA